MFYAIYALRQSKYVPISVHPSIWKCLDALEAHRKLVPDSLGDTYFRFGYCTPEELGIRHG